MKKKHIVIIGVLVGLFLIGLLNRNKDNQISEAHTKEVAILSQNFDSLSYEEKVKWIKAAAKEQPTSTTVMIKNEVKKKFAYPEEVDFDIFGTRTLQDVEVTLADEGISFISGELETKNTFGVKKRFAYKVRLIILPDIFRIDDISIAER